MRGRRLVGILVIVVALFGGLLVARVESGRVGAASVGSPSGEVANPVRRFLRFPPPAMPTPTAATAPPVPTPTWEEIEGPIGLPDDAPTPGPTEVSIADLGIEGLVAGAERSYSRPPEWRTSDAAHYVFSVMCFASTGAAHGFAIRLADAFDAETDDPGLVLLSPRSSTHWFTGQLVLGGIEYEMAVFVFSTDTYVHLWVGLDADADPRPILGEVAERVIGPDLFRPEPIPPGTSLFDLLPAPDEVPAGFWLVVEWSEGDPAIGVPGAATSSAVTPGP
jgi:hypothetical protein